MPKIAQKPKTASFNVRMLPEMKAEAERVYAFHGLTLHEAVTVFIKHSCIAGGFPFDLRGAPYTDPEAKEALKEAEQLKKDKNAKSFKTMEALIADLESDDDD
jgi:addiction module RelB/DinJ family antitoxin